MTEIYALKLNTPIDETYYIKLAQLVSKDKLLQINKKLHRIDRERSLLSSALAKTVISLKHSIAKEEIKFGSNDYGKPFVIGLTNCHYNISHSGSWVVCAYDTKPVGIDVEEINTIDMDIVYSFFSYDEKLEFDIKRDCLKLDFFFDLWTLKESYIKNVGKGLYIPLNSFCIKKSSQDIKLFVDGTEEKKYRFKQFSLDKNYKLSLCTQNQITKPDITLLSIEDLL